LGGTDQMNDWNLENDERDVLQILNRTAMLISQLENAVVKKKYVGLRPYSKNNFQMS
jgi:glycine/D-amino acid oxidase-like deaminating enzyme